MGPQGGTDMGEQNTLKIGTRFAFQKNLPPGPQGGASMASLCKPRQVRRSAPMAPRGPLELLGFP